MRILTRLIGVFLLVAISYWLIQTDDCTARSNENRSTEAGIVDGSQMVKHAIVLAANTGNREVQLNGEWRYILSDPTYLLIVIAAIFINIVLLRKLIKKEL
ncbi:MAG: hypothetical protein AAF705_20380 [Bacteroidota bacterium]